MSCSNRIKVLWIILILFNNDLVLSIKDLEFINDYDKSINKVACKAMMETDGNEMKININRYSTYEELAQLAFWNYGNKFSKNIDLPFPEDITWKKNFVHSIVKIFQKSCPTQHVPHEYLNIFREFIMIYLNSAEPRGTNNTEAWEQMQILFDSCQENIVPYDLTTKQLYVVGIRGQDGTLSETVELYPPEEKVDVVFGKVDLVIDNLWWMFSHAIGKCYPKMQRPAIVAPRLKSLFIKDILRSLLNRWADPGPLQNFAPIVGNYDITRIQRNIRFCVTAAYFRNGISEIQMVRPLKVGYVHEGINSIINKKTGATFG